MPLDRQVERRQAQDQTREQLQLAAKAGVVASLVFEGDAPSPAALKARIAIGLNCVLLARKYKVPDLARVIKMVRTGWFEWDPERDGPSDWMRWWGDVLEHRGYEDQYRRELELKAEREKDRLGEPANSD